ncbi:amyloid-beta A4 precursor protein-binding family A member 3 [Neopsephotus bourkii]|uniref:amyloid-beta A4 precursor protein-binding family A member 3 n=1 Tax=Neopsephotus bourkii TaxID=309878 RepID=UPI002AA5382E|nr:amyloid-beta A4 precursor protein-binding family A member 3 [Neopsephotus bourkii]
MDPAGHPRAAVSPGSAAVPEPPAMDTEEEPAARPSGPEPSAGSGRPELPPFAFPASACGSGQDLPSPGNQRGPGPGPPAVSGPGGGGSGRGPGGAMGEERASAGLRGPGSWEPGAGSALAAPGHPQGPGSSDPAGMELDEAAEDEAPELRALLGQLESLDPSLCDPPCSQQGPGAGTAPPAGSRARRGRRQCQGRCLPCPLHVATGRGLDTRHCCAQHPACSRPCHGLLFAEAEREDLLSLLCHEGGVPEPGAGTPLACSSVLCGASLEVLRAREAAAAGSREEGPCGSGRCAEERGELGSSSESPRGCSPEPAWVPPSPAPQEAQAPPGAVTSREPPSSRLAFKEVPGPCEPEDLLDGVIFGAKYLGSTQLISERNPPTSARMAQAQEAVDRIKAPEGESQPMTEVELFVSTQRIKVLTADTQEAMMDHSLQTISYIADIGSLVVLMARRKLPRQAPGAGEKRLYTMICHVFHSADAQVIAQAIGQAFGVAYQRFLEANSIDPSELSPRQYSHALEEQEQYNAELSHFSQQENCKDVCIRKQKGEILGIAIVESGWGSILPTVVIANLMHGGPAERSGELSIGDRLMCVNGMSLVGLPLATCQSIIREVKHQTEVTLNIVHCPPVTTAIIRRPDSKYQLGFCVENGVICSLMRGGIAERGGIRVGHRIIEINGQSVVATPHEKIIQILTQAVSEVHIKTMPASTYRLLTGQEQPLFL